VYHRHQRALHALALHKYLSGRFEEDGTVLLAPSDLRSMAPSQTLGCTAPN